jgi:hypothetical protein
MSRHLLTPQVQGHRRYHFQRCCKVRTADTTISSRGCKFRVIADSPSPQLTGSDRATTETYSPSDKFTPSHHPSSLCRRIPFRGSIGIRGFPTSRCLHHIRRRQAGRCLRTIFRHRTGPALCLRRMHSLESISGSVPLHHSMRRGLAPSLTPDGSPTSPSSPPTETPPDNAEFFNENMMKKLKIVAGVVIIGGVIAGIAGSQIKHRDCQDS